MRSCCPPIMNMRNPPQQPTIISSVVHPENLGATPLSLFPTPMEIIFSWSGYRL
ncbi:hypothetical protein BDV27DRAFT_131013 [Aspergillus caelatus]|uniref:Uncharacterized protein n=1 Tax=Aspergillus caelatus TaxID=61420 RepID=A0A5N7A2P9_9EURO|nr:uncharacterized protein BDV27DRAFT_131013 [Aspergillus caelatus]KAE8362750.1 hypothetical protein BDV27DRAFT_131013 [Aspergillus caelatus]